MMTRFAAAEWRPVPNFAPGGMTVLGLCPHVIVGSLSGADAIFHDKNPNQKGGRRSAHFGVGKDGHMVQWVDTKDRAWAQAAGNPLYVSAECEGLDSEPHTPAQVTALATLLAWLNETEGVPFAVVDHPGDRGVISHRNGGIAWGGHSCPGDQRHAQRGEIVARARHLHDLAPLPVPGPASPHAGPGPAPLPVMPFPEDMMLPIATNPANGRYWVLTGPDGGIASFEGDGSPSDVFFGNLLDHPEYNAGAGHANGPAVNIEFWPQGVNGEGYVIYCDDRAEDGRVRPYHFDAGTRK